MLQASVEGWFEVPANIVFNVYTYKKPSPLLGFQNVPTAGDFAT